MTEPSMPPATDDADASPVPPRSLANWLRASLVPLILVGVASVHIVRVHFDGLSSWRGGGFGMYAGFHPRHYDAWLIRDDTGEAYRYEKSGEYNTGPFVDLIRPNLTHVNERRLQQTLDRLPADWRDTARLQIWCLDFDPETSRLTRKLVVEVTNIPESEPPGSQNAADKSDGGSR